MVRRGVVVQQATLKSDTLIKFADSKYALENCDVHIASAWKGQLAETLETARVGVPTCVCLNLEELKCFEPVERQYEHWGVIFQNSIAIQPSNPAFPTHSGLIVLMGSPRSGYIEASFLQPVNFVSAYVTSSQRLVMSAYDRDRQLLVQTVLPGANLANSDSAVPPNTLLSVTAKNIHSVTFCAFDGQFTLDDFHFCI
ncbi:hypothetical protein H6G76_08590 [Nostoc sp. FACHB-152]|uniref:hypothetical protein n=1 Tax=unclassified Nostoc TaxID=2593658 RepID=UPI001685C4A2|nr:MULTISPECIES: hypothetical protein [unclassified Nostoc]MBD2447222.1 hypothetical protein [Nostoc sp. FACHB-152]MBD2468177.1 hypothetical protein [Nostoc sp. FACHB-145]